MNNRTPPASGLEVMLASNPGAPPAPGLGTPPIPELSLAGIRKSYGSLQVLADITMEVGRNRIVAVLGPSACGKTTLLSIMAGLLEPDGGSITGNRNKSFSFLFQEPRLLDWLTVLGNLTFVLEGPYSNAESRQVAEEYLELTGLVEYRNYHPGQLSGGQRQRVAMARALAYPAQILLMDEPFKSLDLALKYELIDLFLRTWQQQSRTVVGVTHDVKEALMLSDEIYVLSEKPTVIRNRWTVDLPRSERRLDGAAFLELEGRITRDLLDTAGRSSPDRSGPAGFDTSGENHDHIISGDK